MKRERNIWTFILCALLLVACHPYNPSSYRGLPKEYSAAYIQTHGHCYDSILLAVVSLDLYSEGLELNEDHHIVGTGYNLYFSDLFVPDSLLEEGVYQSLTTRPYTPDSLTFLPGMDFEGYPYGTYILNIENDQVKQIQLVDSGNIVYRNDSLTCTLYFRNAYGSKTTYRCSFKGPLILW